MPVRAVPFPLPDASLLTLPAEALAAIAVSTVQRAYHVDLSYTPASLDMVDTLILERMTPGRYTRERYPAMLAFVLGAYIGEVLRRTVTGGAWGERPDDIFATPLPFLLFTLGEYARQVNVVEDTMAYLWTGEGALPGAYAREQMAALHQLGFTVPAGIPLPRIPAR